MKPIYYYKAVSGRTVFVTFDKVGAYEWTNQKSPVKRGSIQDLTSFSELRGKKVELNGFTGRIVSCCPVDQELTGKYQGGNKYWDHPKLLNMNHLVQVYWEKGTQSCWQKFDDLKLL